MLNGGLEKQSPIGYWPNANVSYRIWTVRLNPMETNLPKCMRHQNGTAANCLFVDGHVDARKSTWMLNIGTHSRFWDTYQDAE
jgi:prepilin-type processing-associated H-X9-DG protein